MHKIMLFLMAISIGLSAQAFDWSSLLAQPYQTAQPYQSYQPQQYQQYPSGQAFFPAAQPNQSVYSVTQPYVQQYNQAYSQDPYQYQGQYSNPYQNQRPYGYGNNVPYTLVNSALPASGNSSGTGQVVKNLGQSLIYSMMNGRGY